MNSTSNNRSKLRIAQKIVATLFIAMFFVFALIGNKLNIHPVLGSLIGGATLILGSLLLYLFCAVPFREGNWDDKNFRNTYKIAKAGVIISPFTSHYGVLLHVNFHQRIFKRG